MGYAELARQRQRLNALWVTRFHHLRNHLGDEKFNHLTDAEKTSKWHDLDAFNRAKKKRRRNLARLAEEKRRPRKKAQDPGSEWRQRFQADLGSRYPMVWLQSDSSESEWSPEDDDQVDTQVVATVGGKLADKEGRNERVDLKGIGAAKKTGKGSKKRKAQVTFLCEVLKDYYKLCKQPRSEEGAAEIKLMLPEVNQLMSAEVEGLEALKPAAKKPRCGPGPPKKEAAAPEPASSLSPPPTSGSDPLGPSEQPVASAADSGELPPTDAAAVVVPTITIEPPTPDSETNKGPFESPRAIKAATGARKPVRSRKTVTVTPEQDPAAPASGEATPAAAPTATTKAAPKRRGRPPKNKAVTVTPEQQCAVSAATTTQELKPDSQPAKDTPKPAKRRGRPPKNKK